MMIACKNCKKKYLNLKEFKIEKKNLENSKKIEINIHNIDKEMK